MEIEVEGGTLRVYVDQLDVSSGGKRRWVPGLYECWLNDEPISGDEAQRLIAQAAAADA